MNFNFIVVFFVFGFLFESEAYRLGLNSKNRCNTIVESKTPKILNEFLNKTGISLDHKVQMVKCDPENKKAAEYGVNYICETVFSYITSREGVVILEFPIDCEMNLITNRISGN